jgi:2'-hydroxyisoflavone reductase
MTIMKNVLVIGGSYFVGRVFVEELADDPEYRITVVNRGRRPLDLSGVEELVCDRGDSARMKAILPRVPWHAVIDFCGYTPEDLRPLLLALEDAAVGHFLFVSTASVYAPSRMLPICEDFPTLTASQPELGPAADYGFHKRLSEQLIATHCTEHGIPFTCLRPTMIYGKYNYAPRESYFFDRILENRPLVLPEHCLALFQFVSVWDVAAILRRCMNNPATFSRSYNLAAEELVSYPRLVDVLESVMGTTIQTTLLPAAAIDARNIAIPFPFDAHLIYSGQLIRDTLGFRYGSFLDGLGRTYDWYRDSVDLL